MLLYNMEAILIRPSMGGRGARPACSRLGETMPHCPWNSAFPTGPRDPYSKFGWNLNVLPGLPGSILKHVSGISGKHIPRQSLRCPSLTCCIALGISMPWLYIGMLFSTFCWHVEDNYLYSINYNHFGSSKVWYGVPSRSAEAFESAFRAMLPEEMAKRPELLHDLTTMVSFWGRSRRTVFGPALGAS